MTIEQSADSGFNAVWIDFIEGIYNNRQLVIAKSALGWRLCWLYSN